MVFNKSFVPKFLKIKKEIKIDKIKRATKYNFPSSSDLIHFSWGPIAMKIKNGMRKGMINL